MGAAQMHEAQAAEHVNNADVVVRSVAVLDDNAEIQSAFARGVPVWTRMECLARLLHGKQVIAVAGSFGKSTTATLMADCLTGSGLDPTVYVGAEIPTLSSGARWGGGSLVVVEACEYRREILHLIPSHLVITNLAVNHEDEFGSDLARVTRLFESYIQINAQHLQSIWIGEDNQGSRSLLRTGLSGLQTYGTCTSDWYTEGQAEAGSDTMVVHLYNRQRPAGVYRTRWIGRHVARNLAPVLGMARMLGVSEPNLAQALIDSRALKRRYEVVFRNRRLEVVDDNARLPEQVATTLATARARVGSTGRVVAVLGVWGMLNCRNLHAYAEAVEVCDNVFVLPSAKFELANGGPEPPHADETLSELIRRRGGAAERLRSAHQVTDAVLGYQSTIVLTMGYESFASTFEGLHRELARLKQESLAPDVAFAGGTS